MKGIDFAECGGVVELFDGIAYHRTDSLVTGCFASEKGFIVGCEPDIDSLRFSFHAILVF
jgi:hypothetical protein